MQVRHNGESSLEKVKVFCKAARREKTHHALSGKRKKEENEENIIDESCKRKLKRRVM